MIKLRYKHCFKGLILLTIAATMYGCDNDDNRRFTRPTPQPTPPATVMNTYSVSVVNLTAGQPLSPLAVIAHNDGYQAFTVGSPASVGLESLAEGGSNAELLSEAQNNTAVITTVGGDSPIPPGGTGSLTVTVAQSDAATLNMSMVTMLVNTNDAITAARNIDVSGLAVNESTVLETISYDSGTEANSEAAGTIPGPADMGEGFNAQRDDLADQVTAHAGVVTSDDGLDDSVLTHQHRWDNPTARVTITRMQ